MNQFNVIKIQEKSILLAFLLTLFLGPLGLFYSSIVGGVIMMAAYLAILGLSIITLGLASILFLPAWISCVAWGVLAAKKRNRLVVSHA